MNKKYIALTLGPVIDISNLAENTRGLWASSYLFSYFSKQIIKPFFDNGNTFLLPYMEKNMFNDRFNGAGVFIDRYIFESKNDNDFDMLSDAVNKAFSNLGKSIAEVVKQDDKDITTYLKHTLKVYYFEKEFEDNNPPKEIVHECEKRLAVLEQQCVLQPQIDDSKNHLVTFFNWVTNTFLTSDAWEKEKNDKNSTESDVMAFNGFPNIVEISSNSDTDDIRELKPYEKYIAVVYSDGDSMGKTLASINEHLPLSRGLFNYNKEAAKIIASYGGKLPQNSKDCIGLPVYCGGDDLFFFAPVCCQITTDDGGEKTTTIFDLLEKLRDTFSSCINTSFDNYYKENNTSESQRKTILPTLSFGVSITYCKYPMLEAKLRANKLLFDFAKNGNFPNELEKAGYSAPKNNIVFSIQKHSGQTRGALLHKENKATEEAFNHLMRNYISTEDDKMLTSVMHGLREKEFLLVHAVKNKQKSENYFNNNYNEEIHTEYKGFINAVINLMVAAYQDYNTLTMSSDMKNEKNRFDLLKSCIPHADKDYTIEQAVIDTAYNALQFIHLINSNNDINHE